MKRRLLEDAIIIAGEVHQLVSDGIGDECDRCSLQGLCDSGRGADFLCCDLEKRYQKIGTIEEVQAREQRRKEARHHLAVLIKHSQWRRDTERIRIQVNAIAVSEALDFAIQELKKLYK